jgi:hypothetical protein
MEMNNTKPVYVRYMRRISVFVILTFLFSTIYGQESRQEVPPLKDRLFYGGNFSLQLGTITSIEVSPIIGLWVLPRLAIAVGPSYSYYKYYDVKTDIFGGRSYVQYLVFRDLDKFIPLGIHTSFFLHIEDEMLSLESDSWANTPVNTKRFLVNTVLSGVGISQQIGTRSSINFMVLWTLNDSGYNIYSNPEIRIGFIF